MLPSSVVATVQQHVPVAHLGSRPHAPSPLRLHHRRRHVFCPATRGPRGGAGRGRGRGRQGNTPRRQDSKEADAAGAASANAVQNAVNAVRDFGQQLAGRMNGGAAASSQSQGMDAADERARANQEAEDAIRAFKEASEARYKAESAAPKSPPQQEDAGRGQVQKVPAHLSAADERLRRERANQEAEDAVRAFKQASEARYKANPSPKSAPQQQGKAVAADERARRERANQEAEDAVRAFKEASDARYKAESAAPKAPQQQADTGRGQVQKVPAHLSAADERARRERANQEAEDAVRAFKQASEARYKANPSPKSAPQQQGKTAAADERARRERANQEAEDAVRAFKEASEARYKTESAAPKSPPQQQADTGRGQVQKVPAHLSAADERLRRERANQEAEDAVRAFKQASEARYKANPSPKSAPQQQGKTAAADERARRERANQEAEDALRAFKEASNARYKAESAAPKAPQQQADTGRGQVQKVPAHLSASDERARRERANQEAEDAVRAFKQASEARYKANPSPKSAPQQQGKTAAADERARRERANQEAEDALRAFKEASNARYKAESAAPKAPQQQADTGRGQVQKVPTTLSASDERARRERANQEAEDAVRAFKQASEARYKANPSPKSAPQQQGRTAAADERARRERANQEAEDALRAFKEASNARYKAESAAPKAPQQQADTGRGQVQKVPTTLSASDERARRERANQEAEDAVRAFKQASEARYKANPSPKSAPQQQGKTAAADERARRERANQEAEDALRAFKEASNARYKAESAAPKAPQQQADTGRGQVQKVPAHLSASDERARRERANQEAEDAVRAFKQASEARYKANPSPKSAPQQQGKTAAADERARRERANQEAEDALRAFKEASNARYKAESAAPKAPQQQEDTGRGQVQKVPTTLSASDERLRRERANQEAEDAVRAFKQASEARYKANPSPKSAPQQQGKTAAADERARRERANQEAEDALRAFKEASNARYKTESAAPKAPQQQEDAGRGQVQKVPAHLSASDERLRRERANQEAEDAVRAFKQASEARYKANPSPKSAPQQQGKAVAADERARRERANQEAEDALRAFKQASEARYKAESTAPKSPPQQQEDAGRGQVQKVPTTLSASDERARRERANQEAEDAVRAFKQASEARYKANPSPKSAPQQQGKAVAADERARRERANQEAEDALRAFKQASEARYKAESAAPKTRPQQEDAGRGQAQKVPATLSAADERLRRERANQEAEDAVRAFKQASEARYKANPSPKSAPQQQGKAVAADERARRERANQEAEDALRAFKQASEARYKAESAAPKTRPQQEDAGRGQAQKVPATLSAADERARRERANQEAEDAVRAFKRASEARYKANPSPKSAPQQQGKAVAADERARRERANQEAEDALRAFKQASEARYKAESAAPKTRPQQEDTGRGQAQKVPATLSASDERARRERANQEAEDAIRAFKQGSQAGRKADPAASKARPQQQGKTAAADEAARRQRANQEAEDAIRAFKQGSQPGRKADPAASKARPQQQGKTAAADEAARRQRANQEAEDAIRAFKQGSQPGRKADPAASKGGSAAADERARRERANQEAEDAIRAFKEASRKAESLASDVQRGAESLASDVQRGASKAASELRGGLDTATAEAQRAADNISRGSPYRRGRALISDAAPLTAMDAGGGGGDAVPHLKTRVLAHVAGLDRGFAATTRQAGLVEAAVNDLVAAAGPVDLKSSSSEDSQRTQLGGTWRLVYSSGFAATRSTGGSRPGFPIKLMPADLGQVYQGIDEQLEELDNVVELRSMALPSLPFAPKNQDAEALLTLKHSLGINEPRTLEITYTGTDVSLQGGIGGLLNNVPEFTLPELPEGLRPSSEKRSATFDVIFLDEDLRVTRGDRNEIRVFLRT